jgi:hypothetical protein
MMICWTTRLSVGFIITSLCYTMCELCWLPLVAVVSRGLCRLLPVASCVHPQPWSIDIVFRATPITHRVCTVLSCSISVIITHSCMRPSADVIGPWCMVSCVHLCNQLVVSSRTMPDWPGVWDCKTCVTFDFG